MSRKRDESMETDTVNDEMPSSDEITGAVSGSGKGKTNKTLAQLEANFRAQTNHSVGRVDHWLSQVEKAMNSKKYPLTDAERAKIMEHLDRSFSGVKLRYEMKKAKGESFKL